MAWIAAHWIDVVSLALVAAGILWLMPSERQRPKLGGVVLSLAGAALMAVRLHVAEGPWVETSLFAFLAAAAVFFAVLMITNRNPVYSALWFAMVTLCVCGLFLLQSAPFLAAATVIVYAGAIVVTFVFVIMLAQQSGATAYDQRARQPIVSTIAALALLGLILGTLELSRPENAGPVDRGSVGPAPSDMAAGAMTVDLHTAGAPPANPLSRPPSGASLATLRGLGRSLFGDYLFAVELAGTLLLVATIGAIAIAPRRSRGTL